MSDAFAIIAFPGDELAPELRNLVLSRWMRSLRFGNDYFKLMVPESLLCGLRPIHLAFLLVSPGAVVRFAALADDHDVVLGFSVTRGAVLDYIHVHKDARRQGIAKRLLPPVVHTITHPDPEQRSRSGVASTQIGSSTPFV